MKSSELRELLAAPDQQPLAVAPLTFEPVTIVRAPPHPVGRGTAQAKLDWLDGLLCDTALSSTTFLVAYVVAQHLNSKTGQAWPRQGTIARRIGAGETTVRASLKVLVQRGHLEVGKKGARNLNAYRLRRAIGGIDGP